MEGPVAAFPKEVWLHIMLFLDMRSLASLARVCRLTSRVASSNVLWRALFRRELLAAPAVSARPVPVSGARWLGPADRHLPAPCILCLSPLSPSRVNPDDPASVLGLPECNCLAHRHCVLALGPEGADGRRCACGSAVDAELFAEPGGPGEEWLCGWCFEAGSEVCQLHCSCLVCQACLDRLPLAEEQSEELTCGCGALLQFQALPLRRPAELAADRFAELDVGHGAICYRDEFRLVHNAGSSEVLSAAVAGLKSCYAEGLVGVLVMYAWFLLVLYALSWTSSIAVAAGSGFFAYVFVSLVMEQVTANVRGVIRLGRVGQGFSRKVLKRIQLVEKAGIGVTLVCAALLFCSVLSFMIYAPTWSGGVVLAAGGLALILAHFQFTSASFHVIGVFLVAFPLFLAVVKMFSINLNDWGFALLEFFDEMDAYQFADLLILQ